MAVGPAGFSRRRFSGLLDALFGEAWELQHRRRRRRFLLLMLACAAAAAAVALMLRSGAPRPVGTTAAGSARVAVVSRSLPPSADFTGLAVTGARLMLIDYGNDSATSAGGGVCQVATVDPQSLNLASVGRGACDDPALFQRRVMEVRQYLRGTIEVRVATVNRQTRVGYTLGPVLASYLQCSDCWDESIAGPRSLWIYAPFSSLAGEHATGELFRVSERTGRVLQHWPLPQMTRALLAVDDDGLWIAPSIDSGGPNDLYHVAPGMRTPTSVLEIGTRTNPDLGARFLVADRHTVWLETWLALPARPAHLWQLQGTTITVRSRPVKGAQACTDMGEGPATVLGNAMIGIFCVEIGNWRSGLGSLTQNVFRVSPERGEQRPVATVTPPPGSYDIAAAATLNDSYYFLDPPTGDPAVTRREQAGRLYRITPG